MTHLELPFPPAVNNITSVVHGRKITSKRGREYRKAATEAITAQFQGEQIQGRVTVSIELQPPCRRKRDIDNYSKAILDAITAAGVWGDDEQVDRIEIIRGETRKPGMAVVMITECEVAA